MRRRWALLLLVAPLSLAAASAPVGVAAQATPAACVNPGDPPPSPSVPECVSLAATPDGAAPFSGLQDTLIVVAVTVTGLGAFVAGRTVGRR